MKKLSVLHLASFNGNVGDNANHNGFYSGLSRLKDFHFDITRLEIRNFFWKLSSFNQDFVDYVNSFDLFVFGGGNYFELWVEESPTGTSFMIELDLFDKINIPIIFNALGVDPAQGYSDKTVSKFKNLIDKVVKKGNCLLSVRNDGSSEALNTLCGQTYREKFLWTPDAGCNISSNINNQEKLPLFYSRYIAINIAGDMLDKRFGCLQQPHISNYESFLRSFASLLEDFISSSVIDNIVFVPHIASDLQVATDLASFFPAKIVRLHYNVAPLVQGQGSETTLFDYYRHSLFNVCNRFHSNLCSISFSQPTIMLCNYRQIRMLAQECSLEKYLVDISKGVLDNSSISLIRDVVHNVNLCKEDFSRSSTLMKSQYQLYIQQILHFLSAIY